MSTWIDQKLVSMKYFILFLSAIMISCNPMDGKNSGFEVFQEQIDSLLNAEIERDGPGAALLISHENTLLIGKGYGLRDLNTKEPITPTTNMRMGSVSKQFTALAILSLVDRGMLALEDPVKKYLPYSTFENITIEHLLNHTSGIADYEEAFMSDWDTTQIVQNKDVLEWYAQGPQPIFQPGDKWEYSNGAYNLLATIVEKVSSVEFSQYAKNNVFAKSGMSKTNYFNLARPINIEERAFCYEKNDAGAWEQVDGHFLNGCLGEGAVYTNLMDFFNYDTTLRKNAIVSEQMHDQVFQASSMNIEMDSPFSFHDGSEITYGMGQFVADSYAFHGGGWHGTRTFVYREFKRPLTIALFMNSDRDFVELMNSIYLLTNTFLTNQKAESL